MNNNELTPEQIAELVKRRRWFNEEGELGDWIDDATAAINQLTEQVAALKKEHRIMMINCKSEDDADNREIESMQAKIDAYDKVLESHINFLLRLSAFDAPEARSLAATLQLERAELKGEDDEQQ